MAKRKRKPVAEPESAPTVDIIAPKSGAVFVPPTGICGAAVRKLGICISCGYRPPRDSMIKHKGICAKCGGPMRCSTRRLIKPTGRCRMHNGNAAKGIASATFKDGRYSRYLPKALLDNYNHAMVDPEYLRLREDIALVDTRIKETLEGISKEQKTVNRWDELKRKVDALLESKKRQDASGIAQSIDSIISIVNGGFEEDRAWKRILELIEQRRKLVESESDHIIRLEQIMTVRDVLTLSARIQGIIKEHVTEPRTLTAIAEDFAKLIS